VTAQILLSRVALAGPGRAGRAFARSWAAAGGRIAQAIVRNTEQPLPPELSGATAVPATGPDMSPCDILVLAVPDDAIAAVASDLALRLPCRYAFHLSGALSSRVLEPLARRGAAVASLHPVRPFTGAPHEDWRGAFVAVEGDAAALEAATRIAKAVGARPHAIEPSAKPLYHAAASLAAGGAAAVVCVAVRGWVACGIPEEVAREALSGLAARAVAAVADRPLAEAFTGAVARRDLGTVRAHAAALASRPDALALYRVLADEILDRTSGRGREEEIRVILATAPAR
jgi:predicted short-subunit dehydrogenase-like oxidoreductase (DUF2520 family)